MLDSGIDDPIGEMNMALQADLAVFGESLTGDDLSAGAQLGAKLGQPGEHIFKHLQMRGKALGFEVARSGAVLGAMRPSDALRAQQEARQRLREKLAAEAAAANQRAELVQAELVSQRERADQEHELAALALSNKLKLQAEEEAAATERQRLRDNDTISFLQNLKQKCNVDVTSYLCASERQKGISESVHGRLQR
jgi:hypothetical protein